MTDVVTVDEVAQFLHVHPSTVYRLLKQKRIPAFKVGSDWRFNMDSIERWVMKLETGQPSETPTVATPLSLRTKSPDIAKQRIRKGAHPARLGHHTA
jgi:excisionase family DNA binding protein